MQDLEEFREEINTTNDINYYRDDILEIATRCENAEKDRDGWKRLCEYVQKSETKVMREATTLKKELKELREQTPVRVIKDNVIAETINKIRDAAVTYGHTQQLREHIAQIIRPLLSSFILSQDSAEPMAEAKQAVPDGWKLVPVDQTVEMFEAGYSDASGERIFDSIEIYKAMLSAAPQPEGEQFNIHRHGHIGLAPDPELENIAPKSDREMLNILTERFESEVWICPNCSHDENTEGCDSATILREYLQMHPEQKGIPQPDGAAPEELQIYKNRVEILQNLISLLSDKDPDYYIVERTDCDPKVFKRKDDAMRFATSSRSVMVCKEIKVSPAFVGYQQSPAPKEQGDDEGVQIFTIECPFCKDHMTAYIWSLRGSGKRCDCGAKITGWGSAYHVKEYKYRSKAEDLIHDQGYRIKGDV